MNWKRSLRVVISAQLVLAQIAPALAHADEVVEYYGYDTVGSLRVVYNAQGTAVQRMDYLPCGVLLGTLIDVPGGFAGKTRDVETDLDYSGARYYASRTGRFTAPDPSNAGATTNPQRWNRYAYALNNPISVTDPNGKNADEFYQFYDEVDVIGDGGGGGGGYTDTVTVTAPVIYWDLDPWSFDFGGAPSDPSFGGNIIILPGGNNPPGGQKPPKGDPFPDPETPDIPVPPVVTKNPKEKDTFDKAAENASDRLRRPDCANLFGGWPVASEAFQSASWRFAPLGGPSNASGSWTVKGAATIPLGYMKAIVYINTQGPFVNQTLLTSAGPQFFGNSSMSSTDFDALLLLHELGHVVGKFGADASNSTLNQQYTAQVMAACF
jgi:RHS repeat-associated protein